ncbi:GspH/FimT family pseudopilin [Rhodoferax aquaticus]|nr:GspH/FimT family pseudopilin [Rhodoferax aquaticus]
MLSGRRLNNGFTLIEAIVVLAILGLLWMVAVPSYSAYAANNSLRTTSELFYSAVQKARAEAIRRNRIVELVLTNDVPPTPAGGSMEAIDTPISGSTSGTNWVIRAPNTAPAGTYALLDSKQAAEAGGTKVTVNAGGVTSIQFNGLGETTSATAVQVQFRHITQNAECLLTEAVRCLDVRVSPGGQARLCEPNQPLTDNRSC